MHRAQLSHSTSVLTTCASSSRRSKAAPPRFCGVKFQLLEQQGVRFLTFFILPLFFLPRFHLRLPLPPQCRCCITSLRCLSSRLIYDPPLSERQISREIHLSQSVREREGQEARKAFSKATKSKASRFREERRGIYCVAAAEPDALSIARHI